LLSAPGNGQQIYLVNSFGPLMLSLSQFLSIINRISLIMILLLIRRTISFKSSITRNGNYLITQHQSMSHPNNYQYSNTIMYVSTSSEGGRRSSEVVRTSSTTKNVNKQDKLDLNPPKGMRDFPPQNMRLRNWLFGHFRDVSKSFGFQEYDCPVLESEELYVRKAGEEVTEQVRKAGEKVASEASCLVPIKIVRSPPYLSFRSSPQLYNFKDKGDRRVALRPEMTPSLARLVMSTSPTLPLKYFSIPQCFRYERTTRGRRREHYQWNMDVWGVEGVEAEAEVLAGMVEFMGRIGLGSEDVGIKVNSRGVLREVTEQLGITGEGERGAKDGWNEASAGAKREQKHYTAFLYN